MSAVTAGSAKLVQVKTVLVIVAALAVIVGSGVAVRTLSFWARGYADTEPFRAESAQHYRYVKAASESGIPEQDFAIQAPEGLTTATQSILGEQIVGWFYRLTGADSDLKVFIRRFVRIAMSLISVAVFITAYELGLGLTGSLAAALGYALAFPAISRSMGESFLHEHTALLFLSFHWCGLVSYLRRRRVWLVAPVVLMLLTAMLCWKVTLFLFAIETLALAGLWLAAGGSRELTRALVILELAILGLLFPLCLVSNTYLRWDGVYASVGVSLSLTLLFTAVGCSMITPKLRLQSEAKQALVRIAGFSAVLATVMVGHYLLSPEQYDETASYGHVWSTMRYRFKYWTKPTDPSVLPFEVRHYWVPPYTTPHRFELLDEHLFFLVLVISGAVMGVRRRQLLSRDPLLFSGFMLATSLGLFLLFVKFKTVFAILGAPFVGSWVAWPRRAIIKRVMYVVLLALQLYQTLAWEDSLWSRLLFKAGLDYPKEDTATKVTTGQAVVELLGWIEQKTQPQSVILSEFVLAPLILTYTGRSTNVNAYFEGEQRRKFRLFAEALFQDEATLAALCREWKTDYLIYNAHILLRTDPTMSYRYIVNAMQMDQSAVAYNLHFRPERLTAFKLVAQNNFFRVYQVIPAHAATFDPDDFSYQALFDERLFLKEVQRNEQGIPLTGEWIYQFVEAYQDYGEAQNFLARQDYASAFKLLKQSIASCNLIADTHRDLARLLAQQGDYRGAQAEVLTALTLNNSDRISRKLSAELAQRLSPNPEPQ